MESYNFYEYISQLNLKYSISSRYKGQLYICDCSKKGKFINREVWFMNCQAIIIFQLNIGLALRVGELVALKTKDFSDSSVKIDR